ALPEAGVVLVPGVQALGARVRSRRTRIVQFAREIQTPAGRQVVVATDQHLGFGEVPANTRIGVSSDQFLGSRKASGYHRAGVATDQQPESGESTGNAPLPEPEFTLVDIRFGRDGKGVGKLASAANVIYNKEKKIFEIKDYTAQPVRLSEVRSENP